LHSKNTSSSTKHKDSHHPPKKNNSTHLHKKLEKLKILDAFNTGQKGHDPKRYHFLEALINDFRDGGKSVNCLLSG